MLVKGATGGSVVVQHVSQLYVDGLAQDCGNPMR